MKKNTFLLFTVLLLLAGASTAQWQPDFRLTNNGETSFTSYNNSSCIAAREDNVHIVWYDERDGNPEIYYKNSSDGGLSWNSNEVRLTNNIDVSRFPSIAASSNSSCVHVAWSDKRDGFYQIYYKLSMDGGNSWGGDEQMRLSTNNEEFPCIAEDSGRVQIVWQDNRNGNMEIYHIRSYNIGLTWQNDTRLTNNSGYSAYPSIAISGENDHVVWQDDRDGNMEIYYKRSTDGGVNWGSDIRLTNNTSSSINASISVSGQNIYVVWTDFRDGNTEAYCKRSTNGGTTWGADTRLTNNSGYTWNCSVKVSGAGVHMVWQENRDGNDEIYYKLSTNSGTTWGADTRLTNNTYESLNPSFAIYGSTVHVVWCDKRNSTSPEIYYKRNPTGNITGITPVNSEIPKQFSLDQNYPNPFNPVTNIMFSIPKAGQVSLKIYDISGKEVTALIDRNLSAGTFNYNFDASHLSTGVYFYKLSSGSFTETKKMILVK